MIVDSGVFNDLEGCFSREDGRDLAFVSHSQCSQ